MARGDLDADGAGLDVSETVRRFTPLVLTRIRMLGLEEGMAGYDDALSDGMQALWRAVCDHDPARGPFPAYAGRRVYWALVDGLRSRGGRGRRRHGDDLATGDFDRFEAELCASGDPGADGRVDMAAVLACARRVDPRLPEIITLCYYDYTYAEAGRTLGISRQRVSQLVAELRENLSRDQVAL